MAKGRRTPYSRGVGDRGRLPPFLTGEEADFIAKKRAGGCSDTQIAQMLNVSVSRLRNPIVVRGSEDPPQEPLMDDNFPGRKVESITKEQRIALDRAARRSTLWRPDSAKPIGTKKKR